jgi:hypothetical protein
MDCTHDARADDREAELERFHVELLFEEVLERLKLGVDLMNPFRP